MTESEFECREVAPRVRELIAEGLPKTA